MKKLITCALALVLISGCANNPIYGPDNPAKEYQQPFPFKEYQAEQLEETELVIKPQSDVVDFEESSQYVLWTKEAPMPQAPAQVEVTPEVAVEAQSVEPEEVSVAEVEQQAEVVKKPSCLPLYCDPKKEWLCGRVNLCDGELCEKDKAFYQCEGDSCTTLFAGTEFVYPQQCAEPHMAIHPDCLGKGQVGCEGHWGNLTYCNPELTLCKGE